MNIKEAGRYANFLSELITKIELYLARTDNCLTITETHLKSKSYSDASDETIVIVNNSKLPFAISNIAYLLVNLIEEKQLLAIAIEKAKFGATINWHLNGNNISIDSGIEYNKVTRHVSNVLKTLIDIKCTETIKSNISRKFNVEGNQVGYSYDTKVVSTVDFDRNVLNGLYKKLLSTTDLISKNIEAAMIDDVVEFTPTYDIHSSLEEVISQYVKDYKN